MDHVAVLRGFNRTFTSRIGAIDGSYLGSGRALGPSRLLFEVGPDGARVADLRRRLGLDSGYLSRLLGQLTDEGLVTIERDPDDGRQRIAALTPSGRREWRRLDARSDAAARRFVEPLPQRQRAELASALATVERLMRAATADVEQVDPRSPSARATVGRYFAELTERFPTGFDPATGGADDDAAALRPPDGAFVLMVTDRQVIGCGGVQRIDATTAEIKRMWIDPEWRGVGLGARLLSRLELVAAERGHGRVVLDTNATLREAIAMYERSGYRATERYNDNPYAHHWFEKHL